MNFFNKASLLSISILLASCGGSESESNTSNKEVVLKKPENVTAISDNGVVKVSWNSSPSYNYDIYLSTEKGLQFDSYANFDNSQWVKNVKSPFLFTPDDYMKKYFFTVIAKSGDKESEQSLVASAVPRYQIDGDVITDLGTSLVWARCSVGQVWSDSTENCEGEASRISNLSAQNIALRLGDGWRLPTLNELVSLVYCSNGIPDYFLTTIDQKCDLQDLNVPTIWSPLFPNVSLESNYHTSTESVRSELPNYKFYKTVSFKNGGDSNIVGSEPTAQHVRLVKDK